MASMEKVSGDEVIPDIFLLFNLGKNAAENLTTTGSAGGGKRRRSWAKAKKVIDRGGWRGGWGLLWLVFLSHTVLKLVTIGSSCKLYFLHSLSVLLTIISLFLIVITFPISLFMCIKVATSFGKQQGFNHTMLYIGGSRIREGSDLQAG